MHDFRDSLDAKVCAQGDLLDPQPQEDGPEKARLGSSCPHRLDSSDHWPCTALCVWKGDVAVVAARPRWIDFLRHAVPNSLVSGTAWDFHDTSASARGYRTIARDLGGAKSTTRQLLA